MLFNTFTFLLVFLPLVLGGLQLCRGRPHAATAFLAVASLVFYSGMGSTWLPLLLASVIGNYLIGRRLAVMPSHFWLSAGIAANLLLLGLYKYADFLLINLARLGLHVPPPPGLELPLGISFFTFTQLAYLVDVAHGRAREYRFPHYLLFVSYFPHLIAGPILHHREMVGQFTRRLGLGLRAANLAPGLSLLAIGLFKKVVLADSLAPHADSTFALAATGAPLDFFSAWSGLFAYTFQLYFDFSGYTDMALGISLMLNIRLPINFDSPYRAVNLIQFWRRWHITLSRFLRDYLYIPLGGNRRGHGRHSLALFLTMLLGGLWHGAGWTFLAWGAYHGLLLIANHTWRQCRLPAPPPALGMILTFFTVALGWTFFRATDLAAAGHYLQALTTGSTAPADWKPFLANPQTPLRLFWLGAAALIVFILPNSTRYLQGARPALGLAGRCSPGATDIRLPAWIYWRPNAGHALLTALLLVTALALLNRPSPFLYFRF